MSESKSAKQQNHQKNGIQQLQKSFISNRVGHNPLKTGFKERERGFKGVGRHGDEDSRLKHLVGFVGGNLLVAAGRVFVRVEKIEICEDYGCEQ